MCVVCVDIPFILDVGLVDAPAGATQEKKGNTGFLHLLALIFIARRIQPSLTPVDGDVEFCVPHELIVLHLLGMILFFSRVEWE